MLIITLIFTLKRIIHIFIRSSISNGELTLKVIKLCAKLAKNSARLLPGHKIRYKRGLILQTYKNNDNIMLRGYTGVSQSSKITIDRGVTNVNSE